MSHYEGLVRKTASLYDWVHHGDYGDLCQELRLKVFQALVAYDSGRSRMREDKFIFSCVQNRVKDFIRQLRVRSDAGWEEPRFIEDIAGRFEDSPHDAFEHRYLASMDEEVFGAVLDEIPTIPSTLNREERKVVAMLYVGFKQADVAGELGLNRTEVARMVQGIRVKLSDWKPGAAEIEELPPVAA